MADCEGGALRMPDVPARLLDTSQSGRLLDAQASFGRTRDDRGFFGMLGQSPEMQAVFRTAERLAPHARAAGLIAQGNRRRPAVLRA